MSYEVWSVHPEPEPHKVLEVTRTSRNVAEGDRSLIQSILARKAWIEDNTEKPQKP